VPAQETDWAGAFELVAEMTRQFADTLELETALRQALSRIAEHLDAEAGSLWLLDESGKVLVCRASIGPNQVTGVSLPISEGIIGRSVREDACQSVIDVRTDPHFASKVDEQSGFLTRSLLCAPLSVSKRPIGAIELVNKKGGDGCFAEADIHPLRVLATSAALALVNARMAESLLEAQRVGRDLELAAEIQRSLLPDETPGLPIAGANVPARGISGDFYDFLPLPEGRLAFCLGDVSGKGMNAALLMAKTASLHRCLAKRLARPGEVLAVLNDELAETATRGMFVTMVAGIYDLERGVVTCANAGHEPTLWHRPTHAFEAFPAEAPPLGILPGAGPIPEREFSLEGGTLYVFSDGLTEAKTKGGAALGRPGLEALIARFASESLAVRLQEILAEARSTGQRDDLTLLALGGSRAQGRPWLLELLVRAQADRLRGVREAVGRCAAEQGCGRECQSDIVMAVDEACQNIIRHAYREDPSGRILIRLERRNDDLVLFLRDFAPRVDPETVRPRALDELRPGGLGTHLIAEGMDEVRFIPPPSGRGNLLQMVKRIR
jgi:sigma-B regulation protein RsbU (phosphoserine phosphatase)